MSRVPNGGPRRPPSPAGPPASPHPSHAEVPSAADLADLGAQLGRPARGVRRVAHRCSCGRPDVVLTHPRLPDGTPFPTMYYLTCPRATGAVSTLESEGLMRRMAERLRVDPDLAAAYRAAHVSYVEQRESLAHVPETAGISAGGMPDRVKCLHVLVAHSLGARAGTNPLGDEALAELARRGIGPSTAWGGSPEGCLAVAR